MTDQATRQLDFFDPTLGSIPGHLELERQHEEPLPDEDVRRRIKEDLDASLFVEAAAGAGKTTALASRIVSMIGAGKAELERIVAVTFTDRAAGEMKLRLRREIEEQRLAATEPEVRRRFVDAVRQLEVARIGTIHSFCADLLRERPVEAGVDPLFRVLSDADATRLMDRAFDRWFQETLADPPDGVRRVLSRQPKRMPGANWSVRGPRQELRDALKTLIEHRDFPAPWRRPDGFDRARALDGGLELLRELGAFAENAQRPKSWLAQGFRKIGRFVEEVDARERTEPPARSEPPDRTHSRDHDALEAGIRQLLKDRKCGWDYAGPRTEWWDARRTQRLDEVKARRDEIRRELKTLMGAAEADLAARLREELRPAVEAYEELKRREGTLDFVDLLLKARDLIQNHHEVRRELQTRFTHFFVDEFQDTDPLQAEILLLLAAADPDETDFRDAMPAPGKLFLVGDPKQSIYSFRRADVRIYEETKRRLTTRGTDLVHLTTSFRSVPGIQETVNAVFRDAIRAAEDGSQPAYVPLERFREETEGQPAVVALPAPRIHSDYGRRAGYVISESYADAVAAFIKWLVEESGWQVTEPGHPREPVELRYRHVCILSRRLQSRYEEVMRPYVRALEAREVPHVLVGGKGFHEREEVLALRNALQAIEWPDDVLSVYATLKGPFFALSDAQLLAYKHRHGSLHPLRPNPEAEESAALTSEEREVTEALAILASLHAGRNRRPIAHTISRFLDAVRAHVGLANWRAGEQVLANCLRIVDRARAFEADGASSFRAFVELLEDEAERGEGEDAPIVEEGTQGVRIMSVHRAKGLEFPLVILADPTCNATHEDPSRHVDAGRGLWAEPLCGAVPQDVLAHREEEAAHDHAEAVRLAYVAATRARDLLVVPAVGEGEELSGWAEFLNPAIYPEPGDRRKPEPPEPDGAAAPGCPRFREHTVLTRPGNADPPPTSPGEVPVVPGFHTSRAGTPVVWWDPASLELEVAEAVGLRQQEILAADEAEKVSTAGTRAHAAWWERREETTQEGREPEARVVTARAWAARRAGALEAGDAGEEPRREEEATGELPADTSSEKPHPRVEVVRVRRADGERPSGARFGELVHRALAVVDLEASPAEIEATVEVQARILGSSDEEKAAAVTAITDLLRHPLVRRAAEAGRQAARRRAGGASGAHALRREAPVFLGTEAAELVEGVVDLAFREGASDDSAAWTVVDFKTDREVEGSLASYQEQVAIYVRAIEKASGERAQGVLLVG